MVAALAPEPEGLRTRHLRVKHLSLAKGECSHVVSRLPKHPIQKARSDKATVVHVGAQLMSDFAAVWSQPRGLP